MKLLTKLFGIITNRLQQCVFNKLKELHALLDSKVADTYVVWCPEKISEYTSGDSNSYEALLEAEAKLNGSISSYVTTTNIEMIMEMVYNETNIPCTYHKIN
ncbi:MULTISPECIES: hypothetical protein [Vibrio]|uniref:hypothetical protein n=1 Tax=Vibrio TaxID=662 RepID=UPI0020761ADF|nr:MULTISPECIES: hypothetical protein [Vibrio]USD35632.1 hypothetical protein J8Z27_22755 [Vibrio sp. SCSIO 43186]USD72756.1 hypothetical protein J4N41_22760 [Vibrio sp. SCSIO 43139]USD98961.1 hypothetical protein CTT30_23085 [Vibrio coralliilyticus]